MQIVEDRIYKIEIHVTCEGDPKDNCGYSIEFATPLLTTSSKDLADVLAVVAEGLEGQGL